MGCNGICDRYKASKPAEQSRYEVGQKRCNHCNIYLNWDGLFCPCCNIKLRLASRYTKLKEKSKDLARI